MMGEAPSVPMAMTTGSRSTIAGTIAVLSWASSTILTGTPCTLAAKEISAFLLGLSSAAMTSAAPRTSSSSNARCSTRIVCARVPRLTSSGLRQQTQLLRRFLAASDHHDAAAIEIEKDGEVLHYIGFLSVAGQEASSPLTILD
jgi:hypothetical protein